MILVILGTIGMHLSISLAATPDLESCLRAGNAIVQRSIAEHWPLRLDALCIDGATGAVHDLDREPPK